MRKIGKMMNRFEPQNNSDKREKTSLLSGRFQIRTEEREDRDSWGEIPGGYEREISFVMVAGDSSYPKNKDL